MGADHVADECALNSRKSFPMFILYSARDPPRQRDEASVGDRKRVHRGACFNWNDTECARKNCPFEHVCSRCFGDHKRHECEPATTLPTKAI